MVPNTRTNKPEVLKALLENMPCVALLRNLNKFAYNGLTDGNTETTKTIVAKLKDADFVQKSGIHPSQRGEFHAHLLRWSRHAW